MDGERHETKHERLATARKDLIEAETLAAQNGLYLRRCTDSHYQLRGARWLLNLYPGNQRLYRDPTKDQLGWLELPDPWTLLDVVHAAAEMVPNGEDA